MSRVTVCTIELNTEKTTKRPVLLVDLVRVRGAGNAGSVGKHAGMQDCSGAGRQGHINTWRQEYILEDKKIDAWTQGDNEAYA